MDRDTTPLLSDLEGEGHPIRVRDTLGFCVNRFDGPKPLDISQVWIENKTKPKRLSSVDLICRKEDILRLQPYDLDPSTIVSDYFEIGLKRRKNKVDHHHPFDRKRFTAQNYAILFVVYPTTPVHIRPNPKIRESGDITVGCVLMPLKLGYYDWLARVGIGLYIQPPDEDRQPRKITAQVYYKKTDTRYIRVVDQNRNPLCLEMKCKPRRTVRKQRKVT